ncbi:uncharacterized protein LOC119684129 [Teleopsis dalmanni]|uniref:uncharacterized protein LOC119684121 n=1 Tax=Teleopsis dalmanni TaxID=139649 RepID=UPI0018CDEF9F|nr:uncharacterized protein LOC119684121 [Teleopsis dalmanni]XP_037954023.1 uncharacterized protein LOC119684129 [Teleopsis dalmanni]
MGNLPTDRVTATRPFLISGVDFCGPMYTTLKIRGRPPVKTYVAVFVCFTSKAVHFELVSDLTSNCFILCLKRFVGRRGLPERIHCDNATNFVEACRELKELQQTFKVQKDQLVSYAAQEGIEFVFIPPRAPHFGGLWEAAVKSAKHLLLRTAGSAMLTNEELQTLVIQVEAVLNSRPIEPLSQDANDGQTLTPVHLLIGDSLRTLPQESTVDVQNSNLNYARRWWLLREIKCRFWRAWSKDYILNLQTKTKWILDQPNVAVGRLVVVHEDNLPPHQWLIGRVQGTVVGSDGRVRVADVRTNNGVIRRPIHKLGLLPT